MDNVYQTYQITVWKIQLQSFTLSHSHSLAILKTPYCSAHWVAWG